MQPYLKTGVPDLDFALGRLAPGALSQVAIVPKTGRLWFLAAVAGRLALPPQRLPVLIFSLWNTRVDLYDQLIANETQINIERVKAGHISKSRRASIARTSARLFKAPLYVNDTNRVGPDYFLGIITEMIREGKRPGLIIIDSLEAIKAPRRQSVMPQLKRMAVDLKIPVLVLSSEAMARANFKKGGADTVSIMASPDLVKGWV